MRGLKFAGALLLVCGMSLCTNGKKLLEVDFSKLRISDSGKGIRKTVKINDLSGFSNALHLQAIKRNKKISYAGWTHRFKPENADKFLIDYWIKLDKYSRYGLFVKDKNHQMIALLFKNNRVVCNDGGPWRAGCKYKVGKWTHVRYVINCTARKYDIFLDDMNTPVFKGYKYRHSAAEIPNCIWIESDEDHESTTLLTGIKIIGEKTMFPAKELAQAPFFISGVKKVKKKLLIDGQGNDSEWEDAPALELLRTDGQPRCENATVKLLWDDQNLYLLFEGEAVKPELRKNEVTGNDARVWSKDCFEFFIDPGKSGSCYYHFAGNASGGKYEAKCVYPRKDNKFNCFWKVKTSVGVNKWTAEVVIPFDAIAKTPRAGELWGFNAGRENAYMKENTSWSPLNNFHLPKQFGTLLFTDEEYLVNQPTDLGKRLAEKIYSIDSILINIAKQLKKIEGYIKKDLTLKKRYIDYKKRFGSIKGQIAHAKTFLAYFKQVQAAKQLLERISSLRTETMRLKMLFTAGSEGDKKGYIVVPELPTKKIFPKYYIGTSRKSVSLELAGNEYGSFQLAVICAEKYKLGRINISVSDLKSARGEVIPANQVKSFKVDYIKTVMAAQIQQDIPDVLWEGRSFSYKKPHSVETLWFDVYVAEHTKPGVYNGTITIKPDNTQSTAIKIALKVYDFSLPKAASLKNIFCFMPYWAEMYYGKKIPKEKRLAYFDFIMDHRLEPVNLWPKGRDMFMDEDELKYCINRGKDLILLPIGRDKRSFKQKLSKYLDILTRNKWMNKAVFFGYDEILCRPKELKKMQEMYKLAKKLAPGIPRLNTAQIDSRLFGYVDIWCPLFTNYNKVETRERTAKGDSVWWYLTDYPLSPYANFNLDSPGIDPRIIPWMNWKLNLKGLLYWSMNREWRTNGGDQQYISDKLAKATDINWLTPTTRLNIKKGLRWPEIPWVPIFISLSSRKPSQNNGGGNLMYPGLDWKPLPSIRLKNLRDGMQDYEYFAILKKNLEDLKKRNKDIQLIREVEAALSLNGNVVQNETSYTKDGKQLLKAKKHIADLIEKTNRVLGK
jgi:hypothetical protein